MSEFVLLSDDGAHDVAYGLVPAIVSDEPVAYVACRCGWVARALLTWQDTLTQNAMEGKLEALHQQAKEHVRPSPPSLSDLTDLGWFCPETSA